jgi:dihydrodipicolinate synthase/N-acetylneuraminate lyase
MENTEAGESLRRGLVIPACPLALDAQRKLDETHQRALVRYYRAAGAGGIAVGVHTTQFAIRDPRHGLFAPLLGLVADELMRGGALVRIGGVCGEMRQAIAEATTLQQLGYDAALLSLAALRDAREDELIKHCRAISEIIPLVGFYLQPAAGGRPLSYSFWRRFAEIENVVAIKIAPFNRYQTIDVIRAIAESGRNDIALYTGNDDNIVADLLTPFRFSVNGAPVERRIVGGLLGHWAVWTRKAVELHAECRRVAQSGEPIPAELLRRNVEVTDANAAFFDAANGFAGCIAGIHEMLRRQGLLAGTWCLDPGETLSPGQREEVDRVCRAYPHLADDEFIAKHRDGWFNS